MIHIFKVENSLQCTVNDKQICNSIPSRAVLKYAETIEEEFLIQFGKNPTEYKVQIIPAYFLGANKKTLIIVK
jgi:hypothetical protein